MKEAFVEVRTHSTSQCEHVQIEYLPKRTRNWSTQGDQWTRKRSDAKKNNLKPHETKTFA